MTQFSIKKLAAGSDLGDAFTVRYEVFHIGQGISTERDHDGLDEAADQFVGYEDDVPVATARVRYLDGDIAKIERVAVLEKCRGKNYGFKIMDYINAHLRTNGTRQAILESQQYAAPFYEKLGYVQQGDVFEEVGIPHIKMSLELS